MKRKIKSKWLAALRSGEYRQGRMQLHGGNTYCCLGVLCDLHRKETGGRWRDGVYLEKEFFLPKEVVLWAGLSRSNPSVKVKSKKLLLSTMNDKKKYVKYRPTFMFDFDDIATAISKSL